MHGWRRRTTAAAALLLASSESKLDARMPRVQKLATQERTTRLRARKAAVVNCMDLAPPPRSASPAYLAGIRTDERNTASPSRAHRPCLEDRMSAVAVMNARTWRVFSEVGVAARMYFSRCVRFTVAGAVQVGQPSAGWLPDSRLTASRKSAGEHQSACECRRGGGFSQGRGRAWKWAWAPMHSRLLLLSWAAGGIGSALRRVMIVRRLY